MKIAGNLICTPLDLDKINKGSSDSNYAKTVKRENNTLGEKEIEDKLII